MKNKILFVLSLLFGLMFINAGLNKFFNYMPVPDDIPEDAMKIFVAMTEIIWLMPLIGIVEIIGGILIIFPRFRALGALVNLPIMTGILIHHITLGEGVLIPLIMFFILIWLIYEERKKFLPLLIEQ